MERTEPSFIPGWLKGTGGGGSSTTHNNADEGGFSRSKAAHQLLQANSNLESPRKSTSSNKAFSSTSRRSYNTKNTNGLVDRQISDRDYFGLARSKSSINKNLSIRNHSKLHLEQNDYNSWIDGEYGHEVERDVYSRKKDWLAGLVSDGRDKDKEVADNKMRQFFSAGLAGKYSKLKRSQSMGLSGAGKVNDTAVASANGTSTGSSQKSVFEHNFPSLGTEDKQCSPRTSSVASPPRPSVANLHPLWQGNTRSDLSRESSPVAAGGYGNSMPSVSISSGNDIWSSALADVPLSNGNIHHCNNVSSNNVPSPSTSHMSSFAGSMSSAAPLNMAEALTQIPPRVLTPPQVLLESQRLEELALRQSRQLIPMTPSLPKAMSLVDKTKSKSSRTGDGASASLKMPSNSSQKSVTPSKPDNSKSIQGKLLVLKPGKDGGLVMTTTLKSDGSILSQTASQGNVTAASASNMTIAQRKQYVERRVTTVGDVSRIRDSAFTPDEKRTVPNAQNRSDFFNALRKKAAGIGSSINTSTIGSKDNSFLPKETILASESTPVDNEIEGKQNDLSHESHLSSKCNGEAVISSTNCPTNIDLSKDNAVDLPEDKSRPPSPGDLDEEEAAFMRSLGWEEHEQGSELTQEEINSFYQMVENRRFLKTKLTGNFLSEHVGGSVGSMSSSLSSSE